MESGGTPATSRAEGAPPEGPPPVHSSCLGCSAGIGGGCGSPDFPGPHLYCRHLVRLVQQPRLNLNMSGKSRGWERAAARCCAATRFITAFVGGSGSLWKPYLPLLPHGPEACIVQLAQCSSLALSNQCPAARHTCCRATKPGAWMAAASCSTSPECSGSRTNFSLSSATWRGMNAGGMCVGRRGREGRRVKCKRSLSST